MCAASSLAISIRPATRADAGPWEALRCAMWPVDDGSHAEEMASFFDSTLKEPEAVFVAETSAGTLVGVVELSTRFDLEGFLEQPVGYVEGLYLVPDARQRGVTRQLLRVSQQWARDTGCVGFASDRAGRIMVYSRFRH
jgi:aminoglycoside 6'-N-acetyltransferase I